MLKNQVVVAESFRVEAEVGLDLQEKSLCGRDRSLGGKGKRLRLA